MPFQERNASLYKTGIGLIIYTPRYRDQPPSPDRIMALRAEETVDFMTARWARLPGEFLQEVTEGIMNEVESISRVVYDISSKPPSTIEWE